MSRDHVVLVTKNKDGTVTRRTLSEGWKPKTKSTSQSASRKPRRSYSAAETKAQYKDLSKMTSAEAKAQGYKWSGAAGWVKPSKEEQDYRAEKAKHGIRAPVAPKYKIERRDSSSLSPREIKEGGWQRSGATGEYERIPATEANVDKQRQYLRDLNRFYGDMRREEIRKPPGEHSGQTYQVDGRNISRSEYLKILESERKNIKGIQRQVSPRNIPESAKKQVRINLDQETVSFGHERHPNRSTSVDIQPKAKQVWTEEDEIERQKSAQYFDSLSKKEQLEYHAATFLSGKGYGRDYLGFSTGKILNIDATDPSRHLHSSHDVVLDRMTEGRNVEYPKEKRAKEIKKQLKDPNLHSSTRALLKQELAQQNILSTRLQHYFGNPASVAAEIALIPAAISAVPAVAAYASSTVPMSLSVFFGAKEAARIQAQYKAGHKASALGDTGTILAGVLAGGVAVGAKNIKKDIKIKSVSSVGPEKAKLVGSAKKVGKITSRQRVTTKERSFLDQVLHRQGKTKTTDLDVTADIIIRGSRFDLKADIRSLLKGYGNIGKTHSVKGAKHPQFHEDVLMRGKVKSVGKPKVKTLSDIIKDTSFMHKRQTTRIIKGKTKATVKTTPLKDTDADLQTIMHNINKFRAGATSKHQSLSQVLTRSRKTTVKHYTEKHKGKPDYEKTDITEELNHIAKSIDTKLREHTSIGKTIQHTQKYHKQHMHQPTKLQKQVSRQKGILSQREIAPYKVPKVSGKQMLRDQMRHLTKHSLRQPDINTIIPDVKMPNMPGRTVRAPKVRTPGTRTVLKHRTAQKPASQGQMLQAVNKEISRVSGQSYLKYLKRNPAVNTANLGRIQMSSISAARVIPQQKQRQKQERNVRIRHPTPILHQPLKSPLRQINELIIGNIQTQAAIQATRPGQISRTKQKAIEVVSPSDFMSVPVINMNPISKIRAPVPRIARLPGKSRDFRISKGRPAEGIDTDLKIIERNMKSILDVI